jgi:phosphoglycolate phosphatase-like HAD superfamily hydrolase
MFRRRKSEATSLASWNNTETTRAIKAFVEATTTEGSADFLQVKDRIAVFDQDGCLWVEQPAYSQAVFSIAHIRRLAPQHPDWASHELIRKVLADDAVGQATLDELSEADWAEILFVAYAGITQDEFADAARDWLETAKHPKWDRLYTDLVYEPMGELLDFLREKQFKTFICSGGGQDFIRVYAEDVYGFAPHEIIGTSIATYYATGASAPEVVRLPKLGFYNDKEGKPLGIDRFIGQRPAIAIGNSNSDRQMIEWTASGGGPSLVAIVYHDDAEREFGYGPAGGLREPGHGAFDQDFHDWLTENGHPVISMKNDWKRLFAFE